MTEINRNNSYTVVGYFSSEMKAEAALRALHTAGFTGNQIGIASHDEPAITVKNPQPGFRRRTQVLFGGGANPEPIGTGSTPSLGSGQTAAPEASSHKDLNIGDFQHTLTGLSLPDGRSRHFREQFGRDKDGVLLTVDAGIRSSEAETILRNNGADMGAEINEEAEREGLKRAS